MTEKFKFKETNIKNTVLSFLSAIRNIISYRCLFCGKLR